MASKNYGIGLDDKEFRRKLKELEERTAQSQRTMERNLRINMQTSMMKAPFVFRIPNIKPNTVELDALKNKVKEFEGAVRRSTKANDENSMSLAGMARGWSAFLSLGAATAFVKQMVSIRGEFQQLEIAFGTMLGNAEKAKALIGQLAKTAATTPFQLGDVTQGAKQLMAYGVQANEINDKLLMLGDIASGLSLPLGDLIYLYGTTMTQGRVYTRDMIQFMGRGIPLAEELAKQFGVTKDKVGELVTAGKVGAKEFNQAMESMRTNRFNNLMEAQSKSVTGQISNIQDSIEMMFNKIGQSSEGVINTSLKGASWLVEHYQDVGKVLGGLIVSYGTYRAVLISIAAVETLRGRSMSTVVRYIRIATQAQALLNKVTMGHPYVALTAALVSVISTLIIFRDRTTETERAQERFNKTLDEEKQKLDEKKRKTEEAIRVLKDENTTRLEQLQAFKFLEGAYPSYFANMDLESAKTKALTADMKALNEEREREFVSRKSTNIQDLERRLAKEERDLASAEASSVISSQMSIGRLQARVNQTREELRLARADLSKARTEQAEANMTNEQRIAREEGQLRLLQREREELLKQSAHGDFMADVRLKVVNSSIKETTESLTKLKKSMPKPKNLSNEVAEVRTEVSRLNKELSDLRSGKSIPEGTYADAIEAKTKELKEAKARLETLTGVSTSKRRGATDDAKRLTEELLQYENGVRDSSLKGANAIALGGLEGLEAIDEEYRQTLESIERQKQEYMTKFGKDQAAANALYYDLEQQAKRKKENAEKEHYKNLKEKYATYVQQRTKIIEEAERSAKTFRDKGDTANAEEVMRKRGEDLKAVDLAFAMRSDEFEAWVNKVADMSLDKLKSHLETAQVLLSAMETEEGADPQKTAVLRATIAKLQEQIKTQSSSSVKRSVKEWQDLHKTLNDVSGQFRTLGSDIGGVLGEIISEAGVFSQSVLSMTDGIITLATTGIEGIKTASTATVTAVKALEASTIVLSVISSAVQVVQKIGKWLTKNTELSKEQREEYNILIKSTNELAEANKRLMDSLSGEELKRKYEETAKVIKRGVETTRKWMNDYLSSGESYFLGMKTKDSIGHQLKKDLYAYRNELSNLLGSKVDTWSSRSFWGKVTNGVSLDWLNNITAEQIKALRSSPAIWAKLGNELQSILQNIVDADEQLKQTEEKTLEGYTATTKDALRDDVLGFLDDLSDNMEAPAQSFEKHMKNAMKRLVKTKFLDDAMKGYYKEFAEAGSDGKFTQEEIARLQQRYMQTVEEAKRAYDTMTSGLDRISGGNDPRTAKEKSITTASQDSIDTLVGLWHTSVQIADLHAKRSSVYMDVVQDLQSKGWQDVKAIRDFTESINKSTMSIDTAMKDMSTNGVKMK